jgi:ABC-type antimicrobial peptide transport system ATPase subunit
MSKSNKGTTTQRLDKIEDALSKLSDILIKLVINQQDQPAPTEQHHPTPNNQYHNRFVDTLTDATQELQHNNPNLKKLYVQRSLDNKRPPFQKVEVKCKKCGRVEYVSPKLVPPKIGEEESGYCCNGCVRK